MTDMRWADYRGKTTCLAGEVNQGKTGWLLAVLRAALEAGEKVVVLDMAPDRVKNVGGKLAPPDSDRAAYFTAPLAAPRLSGKSPDEVWELARRNRDLIDEMFRQAAGLTDRALFINDVSMYLQAGNVEDLLGFIGKFSTVALNGYYGDSLAGGDMGKRERKGMEALFAACDKVMRLDRRGD